MHEINSGTCIVLLQPWGVRIANNRWHTIISKIHAGYRGCEGYTYERQTPMGGIA